MTVTAFPVSNITFSTIHLISSVIEFLVQYFYAKLFFQVLRFLRTSVPKIPLGRFILPSFARPPSRQALSSNLPPMTDPLSITRTFCGALFFPTVASFLGETLYEQYPSHLQRTILGGLTFVVAKGLLKVYHKQHRYLRQCQRVIMNFEESEHPPQPRSSRV